ncbi:hypothetical protein DXG01_013222 [Tephrocybe rancida]|nr:hypothetical protein DXG01_013222 [Tephrocybe rancida]
MSLADLESLTANVIPAKKLPLEYLNGLSNSDMIVMLTAANIIGTIEQLFKAPEGHVPQLGKIVREAQFYK